ncbi:hypothetical protein RD792_008338 [Penstemon davidsonii]|uniref:Proton-dependent oligopeptide transporter family n=1 Tax=Penstemon davidsonii TaxID=160366 RepID=A0ABR0D8T3_9LAMI|nr:hypothetical protein RD792_008338 [Penstemon davidsonii]
MLVSAILTENYRRTLSLTRPTLGMVARKGAISSMSGGISWIVGGVCCDRGSGILYYNQFSENMRSFGGCFLFCGFAMANYLNSFLISIVHMATKDGEGSNWLNEDLNKGRLDYFYYLVAGLELLNLCYFVVCAKLYRYMRTEGSTIMDVVMEKIDPEKPLV